MAEQGGVEGKLGDLRAAAQCVSWPKRGTDFIRDAALFKSYYGYEELDNQPPTQRE